MKKRGSEEEGRRARCEEERRREGDEDRLRGDEVEVPFNNFNFNLTHESASSIEDLDDFKAAIIRV